jgi:glycosyltransferase involved in cell wall biosynthesis
VPIKNHDLFLAAAAHMIRAGSNALFVIVGGGAQEERLKVLAAELGISAHVRFLGYRADLEHIYAGSDVVALTSHNEGTPVAILEALTAGVHVVATNVGGVADVLGGLSLATMVPAGDAEALAAALMRVGESPMEPQPNHPDAVAIRRRYGVRRLVDDMRTLYDELVPSAPRGWRRSA